MKFLYRLAITASILISLFGLLQVARAQKDAPPANCVYVEQNSSFETPGIWQFADTASPGFLDDTTAHSGKQSAFVGIPANGDNQEVDSTVWQQMQLPAAKQIKASLWWRSLAGDGDDQRYIVVWDLAANESTVLLYEQPSSEYWRETTLDLSPFTGRNILFVIGVHNDGADKKAGLWVDDVHITACDPDKTPPAKIDTPAVTPSPTATDAPTATPTQLPTLTPTPTKTPVPTLTSAPPPTKTPTATATMTPAPHATPSDNHGLPDNSVLPLLAGVFFSGVVALIVIVINLRHG